MADPIVERIRQHPQYPRLKTERSRLGWTLQVMQISQIIAGYTLGGADLLHRAMGKKKTERGRRR